MGTAGPQQGHGRATAGPHHGTAQQDAWRAVLGATPCKAGQPRALHQTAPTEHLLNLATAARERGTSIGATTPPISAATTAGRLSHLQRDGATAAARL